MNQKEAGEYISEELKAFFATKQRRYAVAQDPVSIQRVTWFSPLQRLADACLPSAEQAVMQPLELRAENNVFSSVTSTTDAISRMAFSTTKQQYVPRDTTVLEMQASLPTVSASDENIFVNHTADFDAQAIADALARGLHSCMNAGWEGVHI